MIKNDPHDRGELKSDVARRLTNLRELLKLSQGEFGTAVGLSQPRYSQYETGVRLLPPEVAITICDKFLVTMDWIYRGEPGAMAWDLWNRLREIQESKS